MTLTGFLSAGNLPQIISAVLFFPLAVFFWLQVLPSKKSALVLPLSNQLTSQPDKITKKEKLTKRQQVIKLKKQAEEGLLEEDQKVHKFDENRRMFIKFIGSAGVTVFLFSMFTKRAQAAFFGSIPGPGTVALKDTNDVRIDPAVEHPTDSYRLAELDDSTPSYYGFVNQGGAWFILREGATGTYKYCSKKY